MTTFVGDPLRDKMMQQMQQPACGLRFSISTDKGQIELSVPREMSLCEFQDFEESMALIMRSLKRRFERQAATEQPPRAGA